MFPRNYDINILKKYVSNLTKRFDNIKSSSIITKIESLNNNLNKLLNLMTNVDSKKSPFNETQKDEILKNIFSIAHELKTYLFFINNVCTSNNCLIARDDTIAGPDFTYINKYLIECVSATIGKDHNRKRVLDSYQKNEYGAINLSKKRKENALRVTTQISEKNNCFKKYLKNGVITKDDVQIIFVSMGSLEKGDAQIDYGKFGSEVAFGRIEESLVFSETIRHEYIYHEANKDDYRGIFFDEEYESIAALLLTISGVEEDYTFENTFLYLNSLTKNPVDVSDFSNFVYWKCENNKINPFKNDKILQFKNKKFF